MRAPLFANVALALALIAPDARAQFTISNLPTPGQWGPLGRYGNTYSYYQGMGEAFQVQGTVDQTLRNFTFMGAAGFPFTYQAYIYAWDNTLKRITGGALWESSVLSMGGTTYNSYTIDTDDTPLAAGGWYALFFSNMEQAGSYYAMFQSGTNAANAQLIQTWGTGATTVDDLTTATWQTPTNSDMYMTLQLDEYVPPEEEEVIPVTATPEPASIFLMASGLVAMGLVARRRRRV
jgi:hypothetical protein